MKIRLLILASVLAFGLSQTTAAQTSPSSWIITEKSSMLDKTKSYTALLPADGPVANIINHLERPTLGIDCNKDGLLASIGWPDFVTKFSYEDPHAQVNWKIDDGPVQQGTWVASDKMVGLRGKAGLTWFRQLVNAKKLLVFVPDGHGGQEAAFTLDGIAEISAKIAEMTCG